jgi:hypothetical protein
VCSSNRAFRIQAVSFACCFVCMLFHLHCVSSALFLVFTECFAFILFVVCFVCSVFRLQRGSFAVCFVCSVFRLQCVSFRVFFV